MSKRKRKCEAGFPIEKPEGAPSWGGDAEGWWYVYCNRKESHRVHEARMSVGDATRSVATMTVRWGEHA